MTPTDLPTTTHDATQDKTWKESVEELCIVLGTTKGELFALLARLPKQYVVKTLVKPNGKTRTCYSASRKLRQYQGNIQDWLAHIPVHDAAHGWCKGRSPKTAAVPHVGKLWLVNIDIEDFFPSISHRHVYSLYVRLGCTPDVARVLTKLTTYQGHLAQGLATSPALANLILVETDTRIETAARKAGYVYKRYGDDIALSGNGNLHQIVNVMKTILQQSGFRISKEKFSDHGIQFNTGQQTVVGVTVNRKPNVPKQTRRRWRAMVHNCWTEGPEVELREGETVAHLRARIGGCLSHLQYINPNAGKSLERKFHETKWPTTRTICTLQDSNEKAHRLDEPEPEV